MKHYQLSRCSESPARVEVVGRSVRILGLRVVPSGGGKKEAISEFSTDSRLRFLHALNRLKPSEHMRFVTMTLPGGAERFDQYAAKRLMTGFLDRLRRDGSILGGAWRAEMQKRGAIHLHGLLWVAGPGELRPTRPCGSVDLRASERVVTAESEAWARCWASHAAVPVDPDHEKIGWDCVVPSNTDVVGAYVAKYTGKSGGQWSVGLGRSWGLIGRSYLKTQEGAKEVIEVSQREALQLGVYWAGGTFYVSRRLSSPDTVKRDVTFCKKISCEKGGVVVGAELHEKSIENIEGRSGTG